RPHAGSDPPRARPHLPRHHREYGAVHRPLRHRERYHDRVPRPLGHHQLEHPGGGARHRGGAGRDRRRPRGRHPGGRDVQPLRAPGARAHRRDGHLRVRIPQHRRASFLQMTFDQGSSANEAISQINVTPLVDVMLVLLIIFMVTAPILQQGVSVDLPKVAAGPLSGQEEQLVVNVGKGGQLYLNDTPMTPEQLTTKLAAIAAAVLFAGRMGSRPLPMVAYTVELTDPSALGGRLPPGAPKADLSGGPAEPPAPPPKAEPAAPAKPPEPKPEPKPVAAAEESTVHVPE